MSNQAKSKNTSYFIWSAISLAFMFLFRFIPPFAGITDVGVGILGIFFGVLIATVATGETFWPAVMGLFAMIMCGYSTASDLLKTWFGDTTIQQIIWVMAFTGAVTESGAVNVLARKMLKIKWLQGHPYRLVYTIFFTVFFCSALVSSPTAMLLLWYPILDGICETCGVEKDTDLKRELLLGVYISAMGAYVLPFKGVHLSSLAIISGIMEANGLAFNNGLYLALASVIVILFVVCYGLFMKFVWKTDVKCLKDFSYDALGFTEADTKFTKRQIVLLSFMLFGIFFLIISLVLPKGSAIMTFYNKVGTTWIWIILFAVLCVMRDKDGNPFINGPKLLQTKTMWGIVAVAGCFTICGRAIAGDALGIKLAISNVLSPILGNASWPIMVFFVVVISTVFTNFTNGMPVSFTVNAICIPLACAMQMSGTGNATALGCVATVSGMCAFLTNGAIAYAPLLLGREEMTKKFMFSKGVVTNVIFIVVASVLAIVTGYIF